MPTNETSHQTQKAVLWAANGHDDYGEWKVDTAVEIDIRLQQGSSKVKDSHGNLILVDSTAVVGQEVPVGSVLWVGSLDEVADTPVNLLQVKDALYVPDVKGRKVRRTLLLVRLSDTLPALA